MLMDTGYKMTEVWEHDWLEIKQNDLGNSQREYLEQSARNQTIVTRAALFGGRTEAFKSYHECNDDEEIHYYDVTSLYPTVNALDEYPVGFRRYRPITGKTVSDIANNEFIGVVRCDVIPPKGLKIPVLPDNSGSGRLLIHLKPMTGTWTIVELRMALKKGYKITKIYAAIGYECYNGLMKDYVKVLQK
jgi:hypothetical protein